MTNNNASNITQPGLVWTLGHIFHVFTEWELIFIRNNINKGDGTAPPAHLALNEILMLDMEMVFEFLQNKHDQFGDPGKMMNMQVLGKIRRGIRRVKERAGRHVDFDELN